MDTIFSRYRPLWTRFALLGTSIVCLLVAALACDEEKSTVSETTDGLADRQELSLWFSSEPQSLDPNRAFSAYEVSVLKQLFRPLLWYDENLNLMPMVAEEVPSVANGGISVDGTTYTFKVRPEVKWSDGQPVTAHDFEYSVKRLLDPAVASEYATFYYDIVGAEKFNTAKDVNDAAMADLRNRLGVKAVDDHTLVVNLEKPRPTFPHLMALWTTSPIRADIVEKYGDRWAEPGKLIGNGPFVLKEWAQQDSLVLERNPNWWGSEQPKLTHITFKVMEERIQAYNAYLAGELDYVEIPPEQKEAVERDAKLTKERRLHTELATFAHQFNNTQPPFDNAKVRQAFATAFDRDALLNVVYKGIGQVAYSWLPPGMPGHDPELGRQWKFDPEKAKRLLAEAGYPDGKGLPKITFTFAQTGSNTLVAQFTQEQFKRNLGVEIDLEPLEPKAFQSRIAKNDFQLSLLGWGADYPDAEAWLPDVWGCLKYETGKCAQYASSNHAQYANPEFDRLMAVASRELDPAKRLDAYVKAQKILVDDSAAIFTRYRARNLLIKPNVAGLVPTTLDAAVVGDSFMEKVFITKGDLTLRTK